MTRPPFPAVLDSTIIAAFRSCPQKAFLEYVLHYKSKEPSVHLHAGAAYASGQEAVRRAFYIQGLSADESLEAGMQALLTHYGSFDCPDDSAKSASRTAGALEFYYDRYPLGQDDAVPIELPGGGRGIEFSFAEPLLDAPAHPETGDPLIYCGRMDMICKKGGLTLIEDDKTTSQLGASWPRQWDLRSQFTGYSWGASKAADIHIDGVLVRGVSILKTKYDTMEAITYRPDWQVERWYTQLLRDIKRMIACWEEGYWDYDLDHACTEYGGCLFRSVCLAKQSEQILEQLYSRRQWDPIHRTETPL